MAFQKIADQSTPTLSGKLQEVDEQFKDFLSELAVTRDFHDTQLQTFSPLDAVSGFEHKGLQAVEEVSMDEMMANNDGMRKLLANMLAQCSPGSLSEDDMAQLSGINGRELSARA